MPCILLLANIFNAMVSRLQIRFLFVIATMKQ